MKQFESIDKYIESFPKDVQNTLKTLKREIKEVAPHAEEKISYGIPTFKLNGNLVHFGGFKTHIGFFPGAEAIEIFKDKLDKYETSKGTIRFPLDKPLPINLVKEIVKFRVKANAQRSIKS